MSDFINTYSFMNANTLTQTVLSNLLPQYCRLCDSNSHRDLPLCADCYQDLSVNTDACSTCALPITEDQLQCGACQQRSVTLTSCTAPYLYRDGIKYLLHNFKFNRQLALSKLLAELLRQHLQAIGFFEQHTVTHLLAIPSHHKRLRHRGFNQAQELCKYLSAQFKLPVLNNHLAKVRETPPQSELNARQRTNNLKQAFVLKKPLPSHASIVIVDDIITTGATLNEVHRCLMQQNPELPVHAWAIARTP